MRVLILGAGAQAKYALETFRLTSEHEAIGLIDLSPEGKLIGQSIDGVQVVDGLRALDRLESYNMEGVVVGCSSNRQKEDLSGRMAGAGFPLVKVIHPSAVIAGTAVVGDGSIINPLAVIQPHAVVGRGVMIHSGAIVEHDCRIEDYANLAPGAVLAGHVRVGKGAYVYTGARVIPNVTIGDYSTVGAGAVVLRDAPAGAKVAGVPAADIGISRDREGTS